MIFIAKKIFAALVACLAVHVSAVKIGDSISKDLDLHFGFPPMKINISERIAGKKVILLGLPGAFTPT